eukprot:CAMPEP_0175072806 /NCGR_PEP_ID=MMETSP0052_2-20121109/20143_1 /TAXON_ID=51329 ORGANISM="Polytomella parva, Strain SAG 63-3" /NCGR_SAMPLE_ID=MMETSP0052_2 /ASSEMBLY_ACC=CAM_ASM_000194 /LENGTH=55 /DNA_ID=CAMNT_0016340409 /DNA_START=89 /DNA_END=253 /DNA_ORIENTATION=-
MDLLFLDDDPKFLDRNSDPNPYPNESMSHSRGPNSYASSQNASPLPITTTAGTTA